MNEGLIRRLANLCKDHYVIRQIDDLFIYAGADRKWNIETKEPTYGSQRVQRFYEWVDGIKQHAPKKIEQILEKVAAEIYRNTEVPEHERSIIADALTQKEQEEVEEQGIQLEPLLSTLARLLAADGMAREVAIIAYAAPRIEFHESAHAGNAYADLYHLYLAVPLRLYSQIESSRQTCRRNILSRLNDILMSSPGQAISEVIMSPALIQDDRWRDKAIAWLSGEGVNNQGRVRSNNVAPITHDGLQFRSNEEVNLYKSLKPLGISFAPLPVFLRGGAEYKRIEPDFIIVKSGVMMQVEVDGDTVHHESPAEADTRTTMMENEGIHVLHVKASECRTPELAAACVKRILDRIAKLKDARR